MLWAQTEVNLGPRPSRFSGFPGFFLLPRAFKGLGIFGPIPGNRFGKGRRAGPELHKGTWIKLLSNTTESENKLNSGE